ncbi:MAG: LacI family transcriptional regulator [Actinobacteria bacterium]|nr:LacI family transcriptional regulator [Actinomycetota bacterium]
MSTRLKDIAEKLNLSESTVSRALSNHPKISKKTKNLIKELASEMNYHPNLIAKSLVMKKTKTIGLIIGDITNPFYPEIVKSIEEIADKNAFNIILCNSDYDSEKELRHLKMLVEKRVDGVLLMPVGKKIPSISYLKTNKIPFTLIDTTPSEKYDTNCVYTDQEYGAHIATLYLIENGHKEIALINGPLSISPCQQLRNGFLKALKENEIIPKKHLFFECDLKASGSYKIIKEFLEKNQDNLPTAFLCIGDKTAIGIYDAIYECGKSIPEDFSIIGNDDIPESKYLVPPLTTIAPPKNSMGEEGIKLLLEELRNTNSTVIYKQIRLLPELIIRGSTKRIKS